MDQFNEKSLLKTLIFISAIISITASDWSNSVSGSPIGSGAVIDDSRNIRHVEGGFHSAFISYFDETLRQFKNKSEVGTYGEGKVGPVSGYVYHVVSQNDKNDHTGCVLPLLTTSSRFNSVDNSEYPPPGQPWIALIKRGKCNFEVKVDNAHRSHAAGVLVYDDRDKDHLDRMKLMDTERNISAIFTYKWKGEEIARLVDSGSRILLNITVGTHTLKSFPTINRTSVLFVSISFIVLMIISLTWLVFYYVQRFRYIHAKDKLSRQLCNAAKKALSRIPTKNIKPNDKEMEGDGECCAVCIEPYKICDIIRILPCRHEFHKYCIDPWLLEHRTCPMCKMDILKHYGFVFTGSQESILHVDIEEAIPPESPPAYLESPASPSSIIHAERQSLLQTSRPPMMSSDSFHSSRATTPDELTPSLEETNQEAAVASTPAARSGGMCVSCLAAPVATEIEIRQLEKEQKSKSSKPKEPKETTPPENIAVTIEKNYTSPSLEDDENYETSSDE